MTSDEKRNSVIRKPLLLLVAGLMMICLAAVSAPAQVERDQCAGVNKEINPKALEAIIEKYRRGEPVADGLFYCQKAFPTIIKHALDPNPKVRERMTFFLGQHYSPVALQALVRQIETYSADPSAFPVAYAARYPCYFFRKVKAPSLAQVLTTRIKSRSDAFKRDEIELIGCLASHDARARNLLEEMSRPSFPISLSEQDRGVFSKLITYALAEAGVKEDEEKVLADIESQSQTGDPERIESALEELKQFTNCRILQHYAQFIPDKRPARKVKITNDPNDPRFSLESNQVQLRIGDMAIVRFASVYGTKVTGTDERDFSENKAYTDEEMERVYERVKKALEGARFSTCRSRK